MLYKSYGTHRADYRVEYFSVKCPGKSSCSPEHLCVGVVMLLHGHLVTDDALPRSDGRGPLGDTLPWHGYVRAVQLPQL